MKSNPFYRKEYLDAVYVVRTAEKVAKAIDLIKKYTKDKDTVAVTVSGKDSIVSFHITLTALQGSSVQIHTVISRYFVDRPLPREVFEELVKIVKQYVNHVVVHNEPWNVHANLFDIIARRYNYNIIVTGIRHGENGFHLPVERYRWGLTINPIVDWAVRDVWAYINHHRLPIPSVYGRALVPWSRLQDIVFT